MSIKDGSEANFQVHVEWIKRKYGENHDLSKMLSADLNWLKFINGCRNALQHPEDEQ